MVRCWVVVLACLSMGISGKLAAGCASYGGVVGEERFEGLVFPGEPAITDESGFKFAVWEDSSHGFIFGYIEDAEVRQVVMNMVEAEEACAGVLQAWAGPLGVELLFAETYDHPDFPGVVLDATLRDEDSGFAVRVRTIATEETVYLLATIGVDPRIHGTFVDAFNVRKKVGELI